MNIKKANEFIDQQFVKKEPKVQHMKMDVSEAPAECVEILAFKNEIDKLCVKHHYVARSEYRDILPKYQKAVDHFTVLVNSKMLDNFCAQHKMNSKEILLRP